MFPKLGPHLWLLDTTGATVVVSLTVETVVEVVLIVAVVDVVEVVPAMVVSST